MSLLGRFTPEKESRYQLYRRMGEPRGLSRRVQKILPPLGFETRTVQPVASRYTNYGITVALPFMCLHNNPKNVRILLRNLLPSTYFSTMIWCNATTMGVVSTTCTRDVHNHQECQRIKQRWLCRVYSEATGILWCSTYLLVYLWVLGAKILCQGLPVSSPRLILQVHATALWERTSVVLDLRAHLFHGRQ
jgi:hypothetical protein